MSRKMLAQAAALAACFTCVSALDIVKTTESPSGQVIDWVVPESQLASGKIASPPPLPSYHDPSLDIAGMIANNPYLQGPAGAVPVARRGDYQAVSKQAPHMLTTASSSSSNGARGKRAKRQTNYSGDHWYCASNEQVNNIGSQATFSMFDAFVQSSGDFSLLQTAVERSNGGANGEKQTVESGWINFPDQVANPHLFTFFTTNGYTAEGNNIGGWNTEQDGWVQSSSSIYPGMELTPLSTIGGSQNDFTIEYMLHEGNWWLYAVNAWIGYYPGSLFTPSGGSPSATLETMSDYIYFYGEVFQTETAETTTDMGSGEFPSAGQGQSAYIRNMLYLPSGSTDTVNYNGGSGVLISDSTRYNMVENWNSGGDWGSYVYLGGPGAGGQVGS